MISVHFQGKPFNIILIQVYAQIADAKEAVVKKKKKKEAVVDQIYEDLQDLLELTPKKDVLFII